jgi:Septum formation
MSTEARGDGKPDAVGATGADAVVDGAEPTATAVEVPAGEVPAAEEPAGEVPAGEVPDAEVPDAEVPDAEVLAAEVPRQAAPDDAADAVEAPAEGEGPGTPEAAEAVVAESAEASEADEGDEPDEGDGPGEVDELDEAGQPDEADEADASGEDGAEYEDYEVYESVEIYESVEVYESDEVAEPRRARRWPRLLLALGFVVLAAAIVGGAIAIVGSLTHGFKKPVKITYKSSPVFSLKTGDCFDPLGQNYTLVACDSPHQAEVFATFPLSGAKWPGTTAVRAKASAGCASRLTGYVNPQLAVSLTSTYVYPDSVAWQAGTRTVICEVRATSGELTGSVRGATAKAG